MYTYRANQKAIYNSFCSPYVTAILGQRRVGKTTLVQHYITKHPEHKWVSFNLDHRSEREQIIDGQLKKMIIQSAVQNIGEGEPLWVVVDEAQKCPELFEQIKILYDHYKDQNAIKFVLTGSGSLELHRLSAESLAGRIELFSLREFSLHETVLLQNPGIENQQVSMLDTLLTGSIHEHIDTILHKLTPQQKLLEQALSHHLQWGGLPEVITADTTEKRISYLSNYLQTYLEKDIRDLETISDIWLFQQLIKVSAEQTGSIRDDKKIIEALSCSRNTLKKYRGILQATLVYQEIFPFIASTVKRVVKSPKGYLSNNGLISYLSGIHELEVLKATSIIGHRFENWFLNELRVWLDRKIEHTEIYYWRTHTGSEVDFVVEIAPQILPFEVTYARTVSSKKIKNLLKFMALEPKAKAGFVIYNGEYRYDRNNGIYYLPAWAIG